MRGNRCNGGFRYRNRRDNRQDNGQGSRLDTKNGRSLVLLAITGVVQDLLSQDSKIKYIVHKIFKPKQIVESKTEKKEIIEAEYKIIDGEKHE